MKIDGIVDLRLFQEWQNSRLRTPTTQSSAIEGDGHSSRGSKAARREAIVRGVIILDRETELLQVVDALDAAGDLAGLLDGR